MKKINVSALFFLVLVLVFGACGKDTQDQPAKIEKPALPPEDQGVVVATAILQTFNLAVADVHKLVKDKPEAATVKSQLKDIIQKYTQKMQDLNIKYLALKDKDIALFGSANSFLGEYRGKHVWEMNSKLDAIRYHYQQQQDEEMDKLIHQELINLLDIAVKR